MGGTDGDTCGGTEGGTEGRLARTILITGCSSGIGHHAAHALHGRGWRVFATCRKEEDCQRLRDEGLESFRLDYEEAHSIGVAFDEAMARTGGRLDALFNNGAYAIPGAAEDLPTPALRQIFEANFFGWHSLTRRAIPVMRRQGRGRIVMNSSVLGMAALRMRAAYIATKFALEGYTDTLRLELDDTPIEVILLEPGPIRTKLRVNAQRHYHRWIDRENSVWARFYREVLEPRLYAVDPPPDPFELSCEATTRKLIHALEHPRPRARYYVTTPTYILGILRRLLPTRMLDRILLRG
jgi:NAD(P)-dependent dehydrogenase (short-subunit alcohol dehydrogenase family)